MQQHIICLYNEEDRALEAIKLLKAAGLNKKHIGLMGKSDIGLEEDFKMENIALKRVGISTLVGVLAGIGLTVIPGIGILYGLGAAAGAVIGLDAGLLGGGILSAFAIKNLKNEDAVIYHREIENGNILLSVTGTEDELTKAQEILEAHGDHIKFAIH